MIPFPLTFNHTPSKFRQELLTQLVGAEIHGENMVSFAFSSQVPELATVAKGKN